jgi:3-deoxy-D-manno-octulosonic-acid transferase
MKFKEAYQEKLEAQIKEWSAKLAELKTKADKAGAEAKEQMYKHIDQLRARKEATQQKLNEIRAAKADTWENLKAGSEKALDEMKKTWESFRSMFHHE